MAETPDVTFRYFEAPRRRIDGWVEHPGLSCLYCDKAPGGVIDLAPNVGWHWMIFGEPHTALMDADEAEGEIYGCLECLSAGRYRFGRDLYEGGSVGVAGFVPDENRRTPYIPSAVAVEELLRTPPLRSHAASDWMKHCGNFMAYAGAWGRCTSTGTLRTGKAARCSRPWRQVAVIWNCSSRTWTRR